MNYGPRTPPRSPPPPLLLLLRGGGGGGGGGGVICAPTARFPSRSAKRRDRLSKWSVWPFLKRQFHIFVANSQELHSEPRVGSLRWTRRGKEHPAADVPLLFSCVAARDSFGRRKEGRNLSFFCCGGLRLRRSREREKGEKKKIYCRSRGNKRGSVSEVGGGRGGSLFVFLSLSRIRRRTLPRSCFSWDRMKKKKIMATINL